MKVRLLLFGSARRLVGTAELSLDAGPGARVADLLADARLGPLAGHAGHLRFAVNEEFAAAERSLAEGDTVAVLPPASGG
ncbi:MAG: MoaD/ThiS family protein [Elusimicrobia bacterium]|nr:MoaD/ThiS family protein [Elusimicrobiota bacterium]